MASYSNGSYNSGSYSGGASYGAPNYSNYGYGGANVAAVNGTTTAGGISTSSSTSNSNNSGDAGGLRRRTAAGASSTSSSNIGTTNIPSAPRSGAAMVKRLDFMFPKVEEEFRVQTDKGGLTTIIALAVVAILSLGEIASWMSQNGSTSEHIAVNTDLNKRMRINMNITFPALACEDLHVDAMDIAGDSQIDLEDTLVKKSLRPDGQPRSVEEIRVETNKARQEQENKEKVLKEKLAPDYCGPCFGAHSEEGQCCQTCDELLEAYKAKRWNSALLIYTAEQCIREGRDHKEPKRMTKRQGCNLSGYMTVNRVGGNFHIAMGEGVERDGRHIHSFLPEDTPNFNASHIIHQMSFGPGEEERGPMNGMTKIVGHEHGTTGLFQYFIKVVPTTYKGKSLMPKNVEDAQAMPSLYDEVEKNVDKEHILETNRYFFTERFRPLMKELIEEEHMDDDKKKATVHAGHKGGHSAKDAHHVQNALLPGVFFIYEIYPFAVEITRNSVPLTHLLIRLVAIIGGVFTCASWLDSLLCASDAKGRKSQLY